MKNTLRFITIAAVIAMAATTSATPLQVDGNSGQITPNQGSSGWNFAGQNGLLTNGASYTNLIGFPSTVTNPSAYSTNGSPLTNFSGKLPWTSLTNIPAFNVVATNTNATILTNAAAFDTNGAATAAQAFSIQRSNHTGTQPASTITGLSALATNPAYTNLTGAPVFNAVATNTNATILTNNGTGTLTGTLTTNSSVPAVSITGALTSLTNYGIPQTNSWTASAGGVYLSYSSGTNVVTDPSSPATNASYVTVVLTGSAVVGDQLFYPSSSRIIRTYNGTKWTTTGGNPQLSILATFGNAAGTSTSARQQQLQIFTSPDYGATLTQLGSSARLIGGTFVRDPNIYYTNGNYYVAATAAWITTNFNIFSSKDLVNWLPCAQVATPTNCITTWSPCFTDADGSLHIIFSASPTQSGGYANANQYYETHPTVATNLAAAWSTPTNVVVTNIPSGYGTNQFGNAIIKVGSTYNLFTISGPSESVYQATSTNILGPYTAVSNYPSLSGLPMVDGLQRIVQLPSGKYRLIYDKQGDYSCYADSANLTNWTTNGYTGGSNTFAIDNASLLPLTQSAQAALQAAGTPQIRRLDPTDIGTLSDPVGPTASAGNIAQQTNISITSLSRTTNAANAVVTATVASTAGLTTGMTLYIAGASDNAYNGEFYITVTDATHFTYVSTWASSTTSPTGTITAVNRWITLFSGTGLGNCNGIVSAVFSAAGSRQELMAVVTGGHEGVAIKSLGTTGYNWCYYIRASSSGNTYRIEAQVPAIVSYAFSIAATYEPYAGLAIPGRVISLNGEGPLTSTAPRIYANGPAPFTQQLTLATPALAAGASGNTYVGVGLPQFDGLQPYSLPSITMNVVHPGLPNGLILQNVGQGNGASWLSLQWFNPTTNSIASNSVSAVLSIWPQ